MTNLNIILVLFIFNALCSIHAMYEECFRDCYNYGYSGIRSSDVNGKICNPWTPESPRHNRVSNFCTLDKKSGPWCYVGDSWGYCDIPKCSYINNPCVMKIVQSATDTSITVGWEAPSHHGNIKNIKGYVVLLHRANRCIQCQTQTCYRCGFGEIAEENNFYMSCESRTNSYTITKNAVFRDLEQDTEYTVYILTILSGVRTEEVSKVTIQTSKTYPFYMNLDVDRLFKNLDKTYANPLFSLSSNEIYTSEYQIKYASLKKDHIRLQCPKNLLIPLMINFEIENQKTEIPFNISCGISKPTDFIHKVSIERNGEFLRLSWDKFKAEINDYIICWMNEERVYHKYVVTMGQTFDIALPNKKQRHQICIAAIDTERRTSTFVCTKYSYTPGPVVKLRAVLTSKYVLLSWQTTRDDCHHGYVVNITSNNRECQTIIIHMEHYFIDVAKHCKNVQSIRWKSLGTLKINNLTPNREYMVTVVSIKMKDSSLPKNLTFRIPTEEIVRSIKVSRNGSQNLSVEFAPLESVTKYNIKVTAYERRMCRYDGEVVFEGVVDSTAISVTTNYSLRCYKFKANVTPVQDTVSKEGVDEIWSREDNSTLDNGLMSMQGILIDSEKDILGYNISASLLSLNLLKISLATYLTRNRCKNLGFMVETTSLFNDSDCMTWVVVRTTCSTLIREIDNESKCTRKEYLKFDDNLIKDFLLLRGRFIIATGYLVKVWSVETEMKLLMTKEIEYENNNGCFEDCYDSSYRGIRSGTVDGRICLRWTDFPNATKIANQKSNICYYNRRLSKVPFCKYEKNGFQVNCDIPKCKTNIHKGTCRSGIETEASSGSVTVRLPMTIDDLGYIILLHNTSYDCLRYVIVTCTNCIHLMKLTKQIQGFYMSCTQGLIVNHWTNETRFEGLEPHKEFFVYTIPLIDYATTGRVTNTSVATTLRDWIVPPIIRITKRDTTSMGFWWTSYRRTGTTKFIDYYVATLLNEFTKMRVTRRSSQEKAEFSNLIPCTKYCLYLTVVYSDGASTLKDVLCTYTHSSDPGLTRVNDIDQERVKKRRVNWEYLGDPGCPKYYRVEISNEFLNQTREATTNNTFLDLPDLERDMLYKVRVRAEIYSYVNDVVQFARYSEAKDFFNGQGLGKIRIANIESGPSTTRIVSWKYSGPADNVIYRIKYSSRYDKEGSYLTTSNTTISVTGLITNNIYYLQLRPEKTLGSETEVGNYSEVKEFFTGQENVTISNVISHIDADRTKVNIFWTLDDQSDGGVFEFIVRLMNESQKCACSVNLVCNSTNQVHMKANVEKPSLHQWENLITCQRATQKYFRPHTELFGVLMNSPKAFGKYTLTIHGLNLIGIHKLYEERF